MEPDDAALTEVEVELSRSAARLLEAGLDRDGFLELTRTMSQAMAAVAAALTSTLGSALLRPGDTERDLGLRYAETLRRLGPLAGPSMTQMLNLRLREQTRQAVVGQAELQSGRLPGAQQVVVAFVDIVGFTSMGEQVDADELGAVVRGFEELVDDATRPPVRLVKTIGDAAMLVAPEAPPLLDTRARARGGLARGRGAAAPARRRSVRGGAAARGRLVRQAGEPRLAAHLVRPARQRRGLAGGARRRAPTATSGQRPASRRVKGVRGQVEVFRVRSR